MVPYVVRVGGVKPADIQAFRLITRAFANLPDAEWSCHSVARMLLPLAPDFRVVDGKFDRIYEHSWLQSESAVIDVYPVAGVSPFLVAFGGPWRKLYAPGTVSEEQLQKAIRLVGKVRAGLINLQGPV